MANPGQSVSELEGATVLKTRAMPLVCVPTTAGTGSEATTVTVITDSQRHTKQLLVHESLMPDLAIIDACLMLGVPPHVTAATGVDALSHAIEAYVANGATPIRNSAGIINGANTESKYGGPTDTLPWPSASSASG